MNYPWLDKAQQYLQDAVKKPPQALCLVGVAELGQDLLAENFSQRLLNTADLSLHPDYLMISLENKKSIGIDQIREIHEFCLISPTRASRKVIVINPVEAMTIPAQQAFLKTLEEPVIASTFILVCSQVQALLPTIRSRCQVLSLSPVPYAQGNDWLSKQGKPLTSEIYALTDGAPSLALKDTFQERVAAYHGLTQILAKKSLGAEPLKNMIKAEPNHILTGFFYALLHAKQFELLDSCLQLRKLYSDNANLNWEMQLNSFILEVESHVI